MNKDDLPQTEDELQKNFEYRNLRERTGTFILPSPEQVRNVINYDGMIGNYNPNMDVERHSYEYENRDFNKLSFKEQIEVIRSNFKTIKVSKIKPSKFLK
jgi:hypothetical protein